MKQIIIILAFFIVAFHCDTKQENVAMMQHFLQQNYDWVYDSYFVESRAYATTFESHTYLDSFDEFLSEFKYLDQNKT